MNNNATKDTIQYVRSKNWQLVFFAMNNATKCIYLVLMGYYAFFTQNILGLSALVVGAIATSMRIFDGITDPIFGFLLDKVDSKFGKYRPFMLFGNITMFISVMLLFNTPIGWGETAKYIYTAVMYFIYVLGYTAQGVATSAGQAIMTNDPKQRPLVAVYSSFLTTGLINMVTFFLMSVLLLNYPGGLVEPEFWKKAVLYCGLASLALTFLPIIGMSEKDNRKYYRLSEKGPKIKITDTFDILFHNKPVQLIIVSAASDKIAQLANTGMSVYLFSNLFLHTAWNGKMSLYSIPGLLVAAVLFGSLAVKTCMKKSYVISCWITIITSAVLLVFTPLINQHEGNLPFTLLAIFMVVYYIQKAVIGGGGTIVQTMIADCADYEVLRTGKFIPGMVTTVYNFIDKALSSVSNLAIGAALVYAGYSKGAIPVDQFLSSRFTNVIMMMMFASTIIGCVCSVIAMKFYPLDDEKMKEIQLEIQGIKKKAAEEAASL